MWVALVVFACSVNFLDCINISSRSNFRNTEICNQYATFYIEEMTEKYKGSNYPIIMGKCKWKM